MVDQTSMRDVAGGRPAHGPGGAGHAQGNGNGNGNGVMGRLTELGNDLFTLGELQAKLGAADFQEVVRGAMLPVVALAVSLVLLMAALPVALLGIADLVSNALKIAPGWGMLLTAALTLVVAGLIAVIFLARLTASFTPFRRSREEFTRNLAWVRTVLVHSRPNARSKTSG